MKSITQAVLLIALHLTAAKKFEECEFAVELYHRHQVPREDIYKHFCIATSLHTAKDNSGFIGIYQIGSQWWCGEDVPSGGCNAKCSDLLDDDIADDVTCANLILSQQGLGAWALSEGTCERNFAKKTDDCLATIEVPMELIENSTTEAPTTTVGTTIASTTTEQLIVSTTTTTKSLNQNRNTANKDHYATDFHSSSHQTLSAPVKCSCEIQNILLLFLLSIMVVILLLATGAVLLKCRYLKQMPGSVHNKEYDEHLI